MVSRKRSIYIFGAMLLGIVTVLLVLLVLAGFGAIDSNRNTVEFVSATESRVYDGTEFRCERAELVKGKLKNGHTAIFSYTAAMRDVGSVDNAFGVQIVDEQGSDVSGAYDIKLTTGKLTVEKRNFEISSDNASKIYDGTILTKKEYKVLNGTLPDGHSINVTFTGKQVAAGKSVNAYSVRILDARNRNVTANFDLVCATGELEVIRRQVAFSSKNLDGEMSGEPVKSSASDVTMSGTLAEGHTYEVGDFAELDRAGSMQNSFIAKIFNAQGEDVSANYDIKYNFGTLTMAKRQIIFMSKSKSAVYSGKPLTLDRNTDCSIDSGSLASPDHVITYTAGASASIVDAGETTATFTAKITDRNGEDVSGDYDIKYSYGKLTVAKRRIYMSSKDYFGVYDGTEQGAFADSDYTITGLERDMSEDSGALPLDDNAPRAEFFDRKRVVVAGTYANTFTAKIKQGDTDVGYNFDINYIYGTVVVQKRRLVVRSGDAQKERDGEPLRNPAYVQSGQVEGHEVKAKVTGAITEVGFVNNKIENVKVVDKNNAEIDYTVNYEIECIEGILTVFSPGGGGGYSAAGGNDDKNFNKVMFEVTSEKIGTIYLKSRSFGSFGGRGFFEISPYEKMLGDGYGFGYLSQEAISHAGAIGAVSNKVKIDFTKAEMAETVAPRADETAVKPQFLLPSYSFSSKYPQTSDVANSSVLEYATSPYEVEHYLYTYADYAATSLNSSSAKAKLIEKYGSEKLDAYNEFVKKNYLALDNKTKDFMISYAQVNNVVKGEGTKITDIATYIQNCAKYNYNYNPELDRASNMAIAFLRDYPEGVCRHYALTATVMYRALGIPARFTCGYSAQIGSANTPTKVYGRNAHAWVEVYIDNIGWIPIEVTGGTTDSNDLGKDKSKNVAIQIKPIDLEKRYDGMPLKPLNRLILATQDAIESKHPEHTFVFKTSGEQTAVGHSNSAVEEFTLKNADDVVVYQWKKELGVIENADSDKYMFTFFPGTLKIFEYVFTYKAAGATKVYDGTPLYADIGNIDYGAAEKALVARGHKIVEGSMTYASITDVGTTQSTISCRISDADGNDITDHYSFAASKPEQLQVTPLVLIIDVSSRTESISALPDDNKALTSDLYDLYFEDSMGETRQIGNRCRSGEGVAVDEVLIGMRLTITITIDGEQRGLGSSDNDVSGDPKVMFGSRDISNNFGKSVKTGVLTITE